MAFSKKTIEFLSDINANNNRDWFSQNKDRYETSVRTPSLELITELADTFQKVSPYFVPVAKKTGGSLMRIYRDTRFAKDKTPYKTNIGIQIRHQFGKNVHAPGYYLHISSDDCFLGMGIWRPEGPVLQRIRSTIDSQPDQWKKAKNGKNFRQRFTLTGTQLKTAPRNFAKTHPLIEDLKRKDFIATCPLNRMEFMQPNFPALMIDHFQTGKAWMRFLCDSLLIPF